MSQTYAVCDQCKKVNRFNVESEKQPVCGACKTALKVHGAVIDATDASFSELVKKSPLPVVVDIWAPWCGPCRMFAPTFEEFSTRYAGKVVFAKLNSDENQRAAASLGVRGIPTIVVFKGGSEVTRQSGVIPREHFQNWLDQFV